MKKIIFTILLLASFTVLYAETTPSFPFVQVQGYASKEVKPDTVLIKFEIEVFQKKSGPALDLISNRSGELIELLKLFALNTEKLESSEIEKRTLRKEDRNYRETDILGYEMSQSFSFKLDSLEKYTELTNSLLSLDNIVSINSTFNIQNREEVDADLVREAVIAAKKKASNLASGAGVHIDSVYAINQGRNFNSLSVASYSHRGGVEEVVVTGSRRRNFNLFIPKTIKLDESVNIIYKINN